MLTKKTPGQLYLLRSGTFIVNFEQTSHIVVVFPFFSFLYLMSIVITFTI